MIYCKSFSIQTRKLLEKVGQTPIANDESIGSSEPHKERYAGMSNPILHAALTVFAGVVVLVTGQIAVKFFIEPVHLLKLHAGRINHALYYYADLYSNPATGSSERRERVAKHFRTHASELRARGNAVSWYPAWSAIRVIPMERNIVEAAQYLVDISNAIRDGSTGSDASLKARMIEELLDLRFRDAA